MPASGKAEIIILSIPDSLLKGADNEKLVRHVRNLNPTAKIVATAELLSEVDDLYAAGADYVTVTRLSDAHELFKVIEAADAGLLKDKRAEMDARIERAPRSAAVTSAIPGGIVAGMPFLTGRRGKNQIGNRSLARQPRLTISASHRRFFAPGLCIRWSRCDTSRSGAAVRNHAGAGLQVRLMLPPQRENLKMADPILEVLQAFCQRRTRRRHR